MIEEWGWRMKFFLKLNLVSALIAFPLLTGIQLMANVYRINRVTGWDLGTVETVVLIINLIGFILFTMLFYFVLKYWLKGRRARYWTVLLWVPYFFLFNFLWTTMFPIVNPGDKPAPVQGLIFLVLFALYPFYILTINVIVPVFGAGNRVEEKQSE